LHSVITTKKVTTKHGAKLENDVIATMAAHNIDGLDDALNSFELGDVMTLLTRDVNLPVAIAVLENTKQFNYQLSIDQISRIAKNVNDINDFT
jgi:rRNA processing protein Krr1/Pno1